MNENEMYRGCLLRGVDVIYRRLTLCDLDGKINGKYKYQVHCEDGDFHCSEVFVGIIEAVNKFIEIKNKIINRDKQNRRV